MKPNLAFISLRRINLLTMSCWSRSRVHMVLSFVVLVSGRVPPIPYTAPYLSPRTFVPPPHSVHCSLPFSTDLCTPHSVHCSLPFSTDLCTPHSVHCSLPFSTDLCTPHSVHCSLPFSTDLCTPPPFRALLLTFLHGPLYPPPFRALLLTFLHGPLTQVVASC